MNKQDILLEIGLEEMPARVVSSSAEQLATKVSAFLTENRISFEGMKVFSTPRRLAVAVLGVAKKQKDTKEEAKGPAKKIAFDSEGNPSKALQGFCRGQGVDPKDVYFKELNGVEYVYVTKFNKGVETINVLKKLNEVITTLTFPKNMRWGSNDLRFVRPIKWLVALFGEEIIDFDILTVKTGRVSRGHRFLGEEVTITSLADYENKMTEQFVMVDSEARKAEILRQINVLGEEKGWVIPVDEDLLEEVNNLVEYPTVFFGTFKEEFLEVPQEVLITSMKEHQRYFPVLDKEGKLLPFFIAVRNGDSAFIENVVRGNEKVLGARLSDAAFFYREDKKLTIEACVQKLEKIVYHEEIGTLSAKMGRVSTIANKIAELLEVAPETVAKITRAAEICKFDIVTNMVYEFPELQGIMGEKYALAFGEDAEVAKAINEFYMPRSAEDGAPTTVTGAVVSIADKLDTIVSFFSIGMIPTGSTDPYALRRQATGILATLKEKGWNVSLTQLIELTFEVQTKDGFAKKEKEEVLKEVGAFFIGRIRTALLEESIAHDTIEAILNTSLTAPNSVIKKAVVLEEAREQEGFKEAVQQVSRVCNIAAKADVTTIDTALFAEPVETELYDAYVSLQTAFTESMKNENFKQALKQLLSIGNIIERYFENVMVMAQDEAVKANRLAQMKSLATMFESYAEFSVLIVK